MTEAEELDALLASAASPTETTLNLQDQSQASFINAIHEYRRLRDVKDAIDAARKTNEAALESLTQALVSVFEAKGISSLKVEGVGMIGVAANTMPKVVDKSALFDWLIEQGEGGLIKRDCNYMQLRSLLNQRLEDGLDLPPVTVCEVTSGRTLKLTRAKK